MSLNVKFNRRSYQKELLDGNEIPFEDIARNMRELNFINAYLGGHAITIDGMRNLLSINNGIREVVVCEIGCGGGDNLMVINNWCRSKNIRVRTIGIDINPECIAYASATFRSANAEWISSDFKLVSFDEDPDIIFNSLFCHHFDDEEMVELVQWMYQHSRIGFFINDLHRHALAYHSIKLLTQLFSKSYLIKNDAPLSVTRGFTRKELESFLSKANIPDYNIQWKWAFRWLVTSRRKKHQ